MPRKLRLWYSKDDYKKEREEELARRAQQAQNEELTAQPPAADAATPEPPMDTNVPTPETPPQPTPEPLASEIQPAQPETPAATEDNAIPSEPSPSPETSMETPEPAVEQAPVEQPAAPQTEENQPAAQPEATTPQTSMEAPVQAESSPASTQEQTQPEPAPMLTETQEPIQTETQQVQTETQEVPVEPAMPVEVPAPIPLENQPAPVEAIAPSVEEIKEEPVEVDMQVPLTDSVESIENYTAKLKTPTPTKAVVCIGEYPINIFLRGNWTGKKELLPIFMEKSSKEIAKWGQGKLDKGSIVGIDEEIDTHFWYDIMPYVVGNDGFMEKIKAKPLEKMHGVIIVSSIWNGMGSALLPTLEGQLSEWNINAVALALLPSKAQPLDGQFNSLSSLGVLASKAATTVIIDRDNLEEFTGVDNNGFPLNGNLATNYLLDLMLAKETFVPELRELSKAFDAKMFTVMFAPGMSYKIYNTLENILNTMLVRPLLAFDLSTATLIYVLVRMPFHLKDKLPRDKIEMAVANWFKDKADLESLQVADPIYTEDSSDRIDVALFIGGFDVATRFAALEKRVERMKNKAVKKGLIKEEDWELISKSLVE